MKKLPLTPFFCISLFFAIFGSALIPSLHVWPFLPFLIVSYYRFSFVKSLWITLGCGFLADLFSSQLPMGYLPTIYVLTCVLMHKQRKHFFEDKKSAFCLYVILSSCVSSFLLLFLALLQHEFSLSVPIFLNQILANPLMDGAYAFGFFLLPHSLYFMFKKWILLHILNYREETYD